MIYFCSDLHGFHSNICYGTSTWNDKDTNCRKYDTVEEMNNAIIDSINTRVDVNDTLIHCGDWTFGNTVNAWRLRNRISCSNIIQINGNHDDAIRKNKEVLVGSDLHPLLIQNIFWGVREAPFKFWYDNYEFICSHYPPQPNTNFDAPDTIWCHGHTHHKCDNDEIHQKYNVIDVGWDGGVYSIEEIINNLK